MKNPVIIIIAAAVISGGGGFLVGMQYQKSKTPALSGRFGNGQFAPGQGFNRDSRDGSNGIRQGFRPVSGVISSVDDKSITVKLDDGSSKIIILSDKTEINQAESVGRDQLSTDTRVMVVGSENSDGSVTASNIQLNPRQFNLPSPTPGN